MATPLAVAAIALAEMAPMIGRWFSDSENGSSSNQMVAARVVDIAKKITGAKDASSAVKILEQDPKLLLQFQKTLAKLDHDMERAYLNDRMSARERDAALAAAGRSNTRADIMVFAAAAGLVACLGALVFYKQELPGEAVGIISMIAGIFGACLKDTYAFEFGSSRGSKNKDVAMILGRMNS